jgi:hypothetical protein
MWTAFDHDGVSAMMSHQVFYINSIIRACRYCLILIQDNGETFCFRSVEPERRRRIAGLRIVDGPLRANYRIPFDKSEPKDRGALQP